MLFQWLLYRVRDEDLVSFFYIQLSNQHLLKMLHFFFPVHALDLSRKPGAVPVWSHFQVLYSITLACMSVCVTVPSLVSVTLALRYNSRPAFVLARCSFCLELLRQWGSLFASVSTAELFSLSLWRLQCSSDGDCWICKPLWPMQSFSTRLILP